jgi:pyridinium-3,5-bisthiocarboxylic acid mononucleotide nickel chelatase
MKTLYLDIFSGISGDMFIGALLDLGVDARQFGRELENLGLDEYHLHVSKQERQHIAGTKFDVHVEGDPHHDHGHTVHEADRSGDTQNHTHGHSESSEHGHGVHDHDHDHDHAHDHDHSHDEPGLGESSEHVHDHGRTFAEIRELIRGSELSPWVRDTSIAIFQRIANAEGRIHGLPADSVHFHEVGAVDSIVDIVGACVALEMLGRPRVLASAVTEGTGFVRCAHGRFPIPAPATLEILGARGIPLSQCDEAHELVTPTGAALLAELVEQFGPMRDLQPSKIGYGLGTRENRTRPNVLRAVLGESTDRPLHDWESDRVAVLETNLDDISAEVLGSFVEKALVSGVLDVFHTPVQMKKNRPGVLLSLLCAEAEVDRFAELILRETSAFGVRHHLADRRKLRRESVQVQTPFGPVAVKVGRLDGKVIQAAPEYESCREASARAGIPLKHVYAAALRAFQPQ